MSYAEQPAARVFSKNGERRYHGPKYSVEESVVAGVASGVVIGSSLLGGSAGASAPGVVTTAAGGGIGDDRLLRDRDERQLRLVDQPGPDDRPELGIDRWIRAEWPVGGERPDGVVGRVW